MEEEIMSDTQPHVVDVSALPNIGDDGEIAAGLSLDAGDDSDKRKKRRPSRRRRFLRQLLIFLAVSIPVDTLVIAVILMVVGVIDVTTWPLYRRLCIASLSKPRLAYSQYLGSTLNSAVMSGGMNTSLMHIAQVGTSALGMNPNGPRQSFYLT